MRKGRKPTDAAPFEYNAVHKRLPAPFEHFLAASQDMLLTDVTGKTLRDKIAALFEIPYLSVSKKEGLFDATEINGVWTKETYQVLIPCIVKNSTEACWVIFVLNKGSPRTYLSAEFSTTSHSCKIYHSINIILGFCSAKAIRIPERQPICLHLQPVSPFNLHFQVIEHMAAIFFYLPE